MSTDSGHSRSPAPHRWSRTRLSLSHRPSLNGMMRRPARDVSLSPRPRSLSSSGRQSSWGPSTSPCIRQMFPNCCHRSSCSRSSTPCSSSRPRSRSRCPCSQSSSGERLFTFLCCRSTYVPLTRRIPSSSAGGWTRSWSEFITRE